jgi:hypothetical protein
LLDSCAQWELLAGGEAAGPADLIFAYRMY